MSGTPDFSVGLAGSAAGLLSMGVALSTATGLDGAVGGQGRLNLKRELSLFLSLSSPLLKTAPTSKTATNVGRQASNTETYVCLYFLRAANN